MVRGVWGVGMRIGGEMSGLDILGFSFDLELKGLLLEVTAVVLGFG